MATQLYLVRELPVGTSTFDLNDRVQCFLLNGFKPETPDPSSATVTNQCNVQVRAVTGQSISSTIRNLNRLFEWAQANPKFDQGVFLYYAPGGIATAWRTRIINGRVLVPDSINRDYDLGKTTITVIFEHLPFWEGAITNVSLTNLNGTGTAGIIVRNCNDGTSTDGTGNPGTFRDNHVSISGDDVEGDLPSPAIISLTNTGNLGTLANIYLDKFIEKNVSPMIWEHKINVTYPYASTVTDASRCYGYFTQYNVVDSLETELGQFELSKNFVKGAKDSFYRVLLIACTPTPADLRLQASLYFKNSDAPISVGAMVLAGGMGILDLGEMLIPRWVKDENGDFPLVLKITGQRTGGFTLQLDFLQFFRTEGFRKLVPVGNALGDGVELIDDGNLEMISMLGESDGGTGHFLGIGKPINLTPGEDQVLLFLNETINYATSLNQTLSVKVSYRPRKEVL